MLQPYVSLAFWRPRGGDIAESAKILLLCFKIIVQMDFRSAPAPRQHGINYFLLLPERYVYVGFWEERMVARMHFHQNQGCELKRHAEINLGLRL